ncbi:hypothetical protein HWV62_43740 [Athelia sp. TMB]|nr:hypothetical protein HWV62_43740 [Athelia sp. TMB]
MTMAVFVEDAETCVRIKASQIFRDQGSSQMLQYTGAETEDLHRKMSQMSQCIRDLEDALALLQASVSADNHTLLRDELLSIKNVPEKQRSAEPESIEDSPADPVDAFGTLTIDDSGESRYFGASAGSETLLSVKSEPDDNSPKTEAMPELLNTLSATFPMGSQCPPGPEASENAMIMLLSFLPPRHRATSLCETFLEKAAWLFRPVKRDELMQDILTPIYAAKEAQGNPLRVSTINVSPHQLSTLYSIFALGALVDLSLPAFGEECEHYHQCARAALVLRSIFDSPMVETVQAILFMIYYCSQCVQRYTRDSVWLLTSLGCLVAQSIGMHRDPARWNMDVETAQRRRTLFWEVYAANMMHSLALGRPPSISLLYVDCAVPHIQSDSISEDLFWHWKYQFIKNVFTSVLEVTLGAKAPDYKTILELDRKVRETALPSTLNIFLESDPEEVGLNTIMQGGYLTIVRALYLLSLHKSYFARALIDHPADPLQSPYATSFSATVRSLHTLVCGLIVARAPSSSTAPAAFIELSIATELFENCAQLSQRVRAGKDILHRLQKKALVLLNEHRSGSTSSLTLHNQENDVEDLAIYSGQVGVLLSTPKSPAAMSRSASGSSRPSDPADPSAVSTGRTAGFNEPTSQVSGSAPTELMGARDAHHETPAPESARFTQPFALSEAPPPTLHTSAPPMPPLQWFRGMPASDRSQTPPDSLAFESSVDSFFQQYAEMLAPGTEFGGANKAYPSMDVGNGADEDWVLFMQESGLL